jgi:hypothetical protein
VQIEPVGGLPLGDDAYFYGVTSEQCLSTGCRISVGLACRKIASDDGCNNTHCSYDGGILRLSIARWFRFAVVPSWTRQKWGLFIHVYSICT